MASKSAAADPVIDKRKCEVDPMRSQTQETCIERKSTANHSLNVFVRYNDENGKSLNDILKEIVTNSLAKEYESIA